MDAITSAIADFASELTFDQIPTAVAEAATLKLVDAVGCGVGGHDAPSALFALKLAPLSASNKNTGRLLGSKGHTAADVAAFVNTSMIRYLDFNDTTTGGHPSDCLGALLAVAGAVPTDGRRFLTAMIVAYETLDRVTRAAGLRERGWDQGFAVGIATAAALGNLMQLPKAQVAHAIAICAASNVPMHAIRSGELSLWKGAATAYATRDATFVTLLAAEGMTGPEAPFMGRNGLSDLITGPLSLTPFGTRVEDFTTPDVRLKYWPVEYNIQAAVWGALELRRLVSYEDLARIHIGTYHRAWHETGCEPAKWDPQTRETADHSLPYIFARTIVDGKIDLDSFRPEAYLDASIRPLMARITVSVDDELQARWPAESLARVSAVAHDGTTYEAGGKNPLGHEKNPMSAADVTDKFLRLAEPVLGKSRSASAAQFWQSVSEATDLSAGLDTLAAV